MSRHGTRYGVTIFVGEDSDKLFDNKELRVKFDLVWSGADSNNRTDNMTD